MIEDEDNEDKILMSYDNKKTIKESISEFLFNENKPNMITWLYDDEIEFISAMESLIIDENKIRKEIGVKPNIFLDIIINSKINRTSRKGWRAEQGVKIIQSNIEEETHKNNPLGLNLFNKK